MSMAMKYEKAKKRCGSDCPGCAMCKGGMMAEGGEVEDGDMVDRIMRKKYSEGGMVANDDKVLADFLPNEFDELAKDDDLDFSYTGANSGDEIGNEQEDEDRRDIVARIMRSRAKRDRMPRPA